MSRTIETPTDTSVIVLIQSKIDEDYLNPNCDVHRFQHLSQLTAIRLRKLKPHIVLCPLITPRYDAIDVGRLITNAGSNTKLLIETPTLPRPGMVAREISQACPDLNFDFFDIQGWLSRCLMSA